MPYDLTGNGLVVSCAGIMASGLNFGKHIDEHCAVLQRFNFMPFAAYKIDRLRVFGHQKLSPFFAHNAASSMAHRQMRMSMTVLR